MKLAAILMASLMLFNYGCQKSTSPVEATKIDEHPTRIISFISNGLPFRTNEALAIVSPGDTLWTDIIAFDEDRLLSYTLVFNGREEGTVTPFGQSDTLDTKLIFIADTSNYKIGSVYTQGAIIADALGFTTKLEVQIYIK
jgi:hypothetical protein